MTGWIRYDWISSAPRGEGNILRQQVEGDYGNAVVRVDRIVDEEAQQ